MKHWIKKKCAGFCSNAAFMELCRFVNRKKLLIVYYHRVVTPQELELVHEKDMCVDVDSFEKQMQFLSKNYTIVSEKEIINGFEHGNLPRNAVWITFDDGYKDNYLNAFPIFKKYNIPATVFITTGYINGETMPCVDYIPQAVHMTAMKRITFTMDGTEYVFPLHDENAQKETMYLLWALVMKQGVQHEEILSTLVSACNIRTESIKNVFMNWNEIRELAHNGIFIGCHTSSHKILAQLQENVIMTEISGAKNEIEQRLGTKVFSFAYPGGKKDQYTSACFDILQKLDLKLCVSTVGGMNGWPANNLNLKRMGISYDDTFEMFKFKTATGSFWQGII